MMACSVVGVGVGVHLLWWTLGGPFSAAIEDHHIVYTTEHQYSCIVAIAYLTATCLTLLLSSQRAVVAFGVVVALGSAISYVFYWQAQVSVWCYFAASASVIILFYFEWSRRSRLRIAGG